MPVYECRKCIPTNIPNEMTQEQKKVVASIVRDSSTILAMQKMRELLKMDITDTKNISHHITREKGHCHRCRKELTEYEGICPKCKRLNLDW